MLNRVTIDQLHMLAAVAECGSFSAAARKLNRVQSAVSQSIQSLEDALEVKLFDRSHKLPRLTDAGEAILIDARRVIGGVDALRARATARMRRDDLPPPAREGVGRALGTYADAVTSLQEMRAVSQVDGLAPAVHEGMDEIARAAGAVGEDMPSEDPFAGLCALDPAHGPRLDPAPLCERCDEAAGRGEPPLPRMLAVGGRPVPFDAVSYGPTLRPAEEGPRPSSSPPPRASPS